MTSFEENYFTFNMTYPDRYSVIVIRRLIYVYLHMSFFSEVEQLSHFQLSLQGD